MMDNDAVFDALANGQRRRLLLDLADRDPRHVPELSGGAADLATANETFIDECLSGALDLPTVDIELLRIYHVHLPILDDYGFIEWEREANLVWKGEQFEGLIPLLDLLTAYEDDEPVTELTV